MYSYFREVSHAWIECGLGWVLLKHVHSRTVAGYVRWNTPLVDISRELQRLLTFDWHVAIAKRAWTIYKFTLVTWNSVTRLIMACEHRFMNNMKLFRCLKMFISTGTWPLVVGWKKGLHSEWRLLTCWNKYIYIQRWDNQSAMLQKDIVHKWHTPTYSSSSHVIHDTSPSFTMAIS